MTERHVVLGSGQIGSTLARDLVTKGHDVLVVRRSAGRTPIEGTTSLVGDVADKAFAKQACEGATVVYNVMNPRYDRWTTELPPLVDGILAGIEASRARLVALDNLYMYGHMDGIAMREDSAQVPCSRKGALRKELADTVTRFAEEQHANVAIVRASDFIGPNIVNAHFGERFFSRVLAGKAGECLGDPANLHAFSYGPDVARALSTLAANPQHKHRVYHVPTLAARSTRMWADAFAREFGMPIALQVVPDWLLNVMGVFSAELRELKEMRYQWEAPYLLDASRFVAEFGWEATPYEEQVSATANWARATFGKAMKASREEARAPR